MKNGAVDFLTKPVRRTTLLAAIRDAIKRSAPIRQARQLNMSCNAVLS